MGLTKIDDRGLKTPIDLLDNEKIRLGTGNDIEIYHSGISNVFATSNGNIELIAGSEYLGKFIPNGAVELYHNNSKKLETTSSGVIVTGTLEATTYLAIADQMYHAGDADTTVRFPAADTIALETAGSERFRVDSSGKVGIGTTSPSNLLHCATSSTTVAIFESTASGGTGAELLLHHNSPSPADGDNIGAIYFQADDDAGNKSTFGDILVNAEDVSNNSEDAHMRFEVVSGGTLTERMRINPSGQLLVGLTSSVGNGTFIETSNALSTQGRILANGFIARNNYGSVSNITNGMYSPASDTLALATGNVERMRIHSNGRVSIGTTSADARLHLKSPDGGNSAIILDQTQDTTNYQNSIDFKNNGTQYAGITAGKDGSNNSLGLVFHTGTSYTERVRVQAGGGISFNGDTAAANALSDYEEGTWTVTMNKAGTTGNADSQVTSRSGIYVKVGDLLFVSFYWYSSNLNFGSGNYQWYISGMPYNVMSNAAGAVQFIPGGYQYNNGTVTAYNIGNYRWQSNNTNGQTTLTMYGNMQTSNASGGAWEWSGCGCLRCV